jgi:ATP-dependent helicase/nuclease subunit A
MDGDLQSSLRHQRIIANAGSGKTHRLTTRYIELLERGVPAEHIVALTFTRKAAGEFLDAIFNRLLKASGSEAEARALARETGMPRLTAPRCVQHLRQLVEKLPVLTLGTLDSFFGRILRAFAFEYGVAHEVTILDDHLQGVLRRQVLTEVFRAQLRNDNDFEEFLELIRQQNRDRQGRDVSRALDQTVKDLHEILLLTPPDKPWGSTSTIWPDGSPLLAAADTLELLGEFERELGRLHPNMDLKDREDWQALLREVRALKSGAAAAKPLIDFAVRSQNPPGDKRWPGHFTLSPNKIAFRFPNSLRTSVAALGRAILRLELLGRLERSRALYTLLARFEARYQMQVRDNGQLTFLDVAGLLATGAGTCWGAKSFDSCGRQEMNFRLDSSYDHWLLDEFQDTSRLQWQALRDLVDEVIQSNSGRRSFFYVGDTKQAIYSWRGGDPRLFNEVADYYNASGTDRIDTSEALEISFRSAREILDTVNSLFSPKQLQRVAPIFDFSVEVLERWRSAWRQHQACETSPHGYLSWRPLDVSKEESKGVLDEEAARLIREVDPLAKGWSCAVLVRTNSRILSVIESLRRAGLPATAEGRIFPCEDSDVAAALLALLRFVAHPNDAFSYRHLQMTPLATFVDDDLNQFRRSMLKRIRETGFHGVLAHLVEKMDLAERPFATARVEELLVAASKFDAAWQGRAGLDEFISFAREFEFSEYPAGKTIRVLTIHAAKGLDFDMVVLPEVDGRPFSARRDHVMHLHHGTDGAVQWGLELPPGKICALDPVLSEACDQETAEECYEGLCLSYVAVTRAKRALYVLARRLREGSSSKDFNRLLHETLGRAESAFGDPNWHLTGKQPQNTRGADDTISLGGDEHPTMPMPLLPSQANAATISAAGFFAREHARSVGSEVHKILAKISWLDEGLPDLGDLSPASQALLSGFLQTNTAARLFTRPARPCSLWREKAFDVVLGGQWISGIFDRVVIHRNEAGQARAAALYDFKTDERALAENYSTQMSLYRKSLGSLIGLPEAKITSMLILVRTGEELPIRSAGDLVQMHLV